MGLFGKKARRLATNAPRDWPAVEVDLWSDDTPAINYLAVGAAFARGTPEIKLAFYHQLLYEDGVLAIPIVVRQGDQPTAVFVYAKSDAEAAAHYSGARGLLRQREAMSSVYYAPEAITPARPGVVLEALDTKHFSRPESEPPPAEYSLWWSTPEDPTLASSPALTHLDRWFAALDGYTPFIFSAFVDALGLSGDKSDGKEQVRVFAPPEQPLMVPAVAPGELPVFLHASGAEGVWFAADTKLTAPSKRNALLKQLADLGEELRRTLEGAGVPAMQDDQRGLTFWRSVRQDALLKEQAPDAELHVLTIRGSSRLPGATTAEERARSVAAEPDEATMEFAGQQLDFALATLQREIGGLTGEGSGEPNLQPFLAMRVGTDVLRTTLPHCTPPDVEPLIPDLLAVRGSVDVAALVYDAYVRSATERSEAVFVRVEPRGAGKSQLFAQRYQANPFGAVGNWTLMASEATLFPVVVPPEPLTPSPALQAFVAECLRETLHWIQIGGASGAQLYADDEPLSSPVLYLPIDGHTITNRFALGGLGWAVGASAQKLSEEPKAKLAVFLYDDMTTRNGEPARALRFRAQERGTPRAFEFALAYAKPVEGRPFKTLGALELLGDVTPLFAPASPAS